MNGTTAFAIARIGALVLGRGPSADVARHESLDDETIDRDDNGVRNAIASHVSDTTSAAALIPRYVHA